MKTGLSLAILLLAGHAFAADDPLPKTTAAQKQQCDLYVAPTHDQKTDAQGNYCYAYIRGVKDAMDGDLAWADDTHKKIVIGNWADGVTADQLIRVFVKFVNENPEALNKPASITVRQSAEAAQLYSYATVQ